MPKTSLIHSAVSTIPACDSQMPRYGIYCTKNMQLHMHQHHILKIWQKVKQNLSNTGHCDKGKTKSEIPITKWKHWFRPRKLSINKNKFWYCYMLQRKTKSYWIFSYTSFLNAWGRADYQQMMYMRLCTTFTDNYAHGGVRIWIQMLCKSKIWWIYRLI